LKHAGSVINVICINTDGFVKNPTGFSSFRRKPESSLSRYSRLLFRVFAGPGFMHICGGFLHDTPKKKGMNMAVTDYDVWAMRVNEAIRSNDKRREIPVAVRPLKQILLRFAAECAAIAGAIGRNIDTVEILGTDRFNTLDGFLDEMLKFKDFSFLEYRYKLPSQKQPGLRFKVETETPRIGVHYFKDLVFWDVDQEGRRIHYEPILFELSQGKITALPHPALSEIYAGCANWQLALRETLTLPFRYLFDFRDFSLPAANPTADR